MIYQSVFGWISTIMTILCLLWCVGLGIFCIVKAIIKRAKAKKELKEALKEHELKKGRSLGSDEGRKKSK